MDIKNRAYNAIWCRNLNPILITQSLFAPASFGPEAKTREGTLGSPACIHTRHFKKVRNVLVVREVFSIWWNYKCARLSRVLSSSDISRSKMHSIYNIVLFAVVFVLIELKAPCYRAYVCVRNTCSSCNKSWSVLPLTFFWDV